MASSPNVLALFGEPDRKSSLIAIANVVRRVKYHEGLTTADLAEALRCDPETVENAENQRNLIGFDKVARLLAKYPEHSQEIRNLWEMRSVEPTTDAEDAAEIAALAHRLAKRLEVQS